MYLKYCHTICFERKADYCSQEMHKLMLSVLAEKHIWKVNQRFLHFQRIITRIFFVVAQKMTIFGPICIG